MLHWNRREPPSYLAESLEHLLRVDACIVTGKFCEQMSDVLNRHSVLHRYSHRSTIIGQQERAAPKAHSL